MGWRPPTGEEFSEISWKWRYKVTTAFKGNGNDKTLEDYPSESSYSGLKTDDKASPKTGKAATAPAPAKDKDPQQEFGGALVVKTLYEGKNSTDTTFDWQDYPPRLASKGASKAHDRVAIKLYKAKDKEKPVVNGRFALKYHQVDVQNPLLLAALEPILKKEDVYIDVNETITFKAPFRPLYFRYDDIAELHAGLGADEPLRQYLRLLLGVLDEMFAEVRGKRNQLAAAGLIDFKHAWTYFPRDEIIFAPGAFGDRLWKAIDTSIETTKTEGIVLAVRAKGLRFNGDAFVWTEQKLLIPLFDGNKPITDLPIYPLRYGEDVDALKEKLMARGKLVLDYQTLTYCTYQGVALYNGDQCLEKHTTDSRILIDVVGYRKHHLALGTRQGKDPETVKNVVKGTGREASGDFEAKSKTSSWQRLTEEEAACNTAVMLRNPEELMFMAPFVEGYALKNKEWFMFMLEDIKPMDFNESAFDHLVYDDQQKDLVLSFVENHDHVSKSNVTDVIKGKGDGLIILLSGPPGTGKTLTAEAVADRTHRPLLYLQAEDLGINAATLAANMKKLLGLATEWDAVILLDEADVFMAERNPQDIARNELVSIFLRELEYYRGIIFLTTNLFQTIDAAFRSRVSLHLLFRALTVEARLSIWQKFLDRMLPAKAAPATITKQQDGAAEERTTTTQQPAHFLSDEDVKQLALWELNGREIKTALKMVDSWCQHKGYDMTLERLENGIKVTSPHASRAAAIDSSLYDD